MHATTIIAGRRTAWAFALVPILLALAVMVGLGEADHDQATTDGLPAGYDSTAGTALLDELPEESTTTAVVLFTADQGDLTKADLSALQQAAADLGAAGDRVLPSQDGTAALAVVPVTRAVRPR